MKKYYCPGCDQIISKFPPEPISYCATAGKRMRMKPASEKVIELYNLILKQNP